MKFNLGDWSNSMDKTLDQIRLIRVRERIFNIGKKVNDELTNAAWQIKIVIERILEISNEGTIAEIKLHLGDVHWMAQEMVISAKWINEDLKWAYEEAFTIDNKTKAPLLWKYNFYNRDVFDTDLRELVEWWFAVNLVIADVNDLKPLNDNYWHQAWDECLKFVAQKIQVVFWETNVKCYRLWWDEIAILSIESYDITLKKINFLISSFENDSFSFDYNNKTNHKRTSVAFWITAYENWDTVESIFERADILMYNEKQEMKWINKTSLNIEGHVISMLMWDDWIYKQKQEEWCC